MRPITRVAIASAFGVTALLVSAATTTSAQSIYPTVDPATGVTLSNPVDSSYGSYAGAANSNLNRLITAQDALALQTSFP